jgi:predicted  nucleic acid-binding Zn-ribbon protein
MSKQIFSKIAKIGEEMRAAEAVKVELAAMDDLPKMLKYIQEGQKIESRAAAIEDKYSKSVNDALAARNKLETDFSNLKAYQKAVEKTIADVDKKAKELGVDPMKVLPTYKEVMSQNFLRVNIENVAETLRILPKGKV